MKIPNVKSTNFFNDVIRVVKWLVNGLKTRDNTRVKGFFKRIYREMKK